MMGAAEGRVLKLGVYERIWKDKSIDKGAVGK